MNNKPPMKNWMLFILIALSSTFGSAQEYSIAVAPQISSCAELPDSQVSNCTDNLLYEFLLSDIDTAQCAPIDTSYQYDLSIEISENGSIILSNVSSWNDKSDACLTYFNTKASSIGEEFSFNPALDKNKKAINGTKYFEFLYPTPAILDSVRQAGHNLTNFEQMPRFVGCEDIIGGNADRQRCADRKLLTHFYSSLKYPKKARRNNIQGYVRVQFVIDTTGMIDNIEIIQDIGAGCGASVVESIEKMNLLRPPFVPGYQNGKSVKVLYTMPVAFRLD